MFAIDNLWGGKIVGNNAENARDCGSRCVSNSRYAEICLVFTQKKGSSFELLASNDGVTYTRVKTVGSAPTPDCKIAADFNKKYFKIKQALKTGQTAVSLPVTINKLGEAEAAILADLAAT
jgi:hypothetical protein